MRGSKPDSNGSQKLLSKEVSCMSSVNISYLIQSYFFPHMEFNNNFIISELLLQDEDLKWVEENIPTTVADV